MQWVNPHSQIILTVADAGKPPQDWMVSAGTPNALLRAGVCRQTLKPGDEVTIRGWRAREKRCLDNAATHANTCQAASGTVTLASGRTALIGYGFAAPEASAPDPEHCSPG